MTKVEFLNALSARIGAIPAAEQQKALQFYAEIIADKTEAGMDEEAAVDALGSIDEIVAKTLSENEMAGESGSAVGSACQTPYTAPVKKRSAGMTVLWVTLIVFGSMIGLPIAIAIAAVIFSIWISLWAVVVSLWAVAVSLVAAGIFGIIPSVLLIAAHPAVGLFQIGMCLFCIGAGILLTIGMIKLTKLSARASVAMWKGMLGWFRKKEKQPVDQQVTAYERG